MNSALLLLAALVGPISTDESLAVKDRNQFPEDQWFRFYYVSTACVEPGPARENLDTAIKLMLMSCISPNQPTLPTLAKVSDTLYRIDVLEMGWDPFLWKEVVKDNPYSEAPDWIVLRADWLLTDLADARDSDSYYLLVYNGRPKDIFDGLKRLKVDGDPTLQYGMIEGESQVAKHKTRTIQNWPKSRGYAYRTLDIIKRTLEREPIEQIEGDAVYDAQEIIIGGEKHDATTRRRGTVQYYLLGNGEDELVEKADGRIVSDYTHFRGYEELALPGSCIQCHMTGLNYPTSDEVNKYILTDLKPATDFATRDKIRAFYFNDLTKDLQRDNEDYAVAVALFCGVKPGVASTRFALAINRYDEAIGLDRAAWESGASPSELALALSWAQSAGSRLPARAGLLTNGHNVPRDAWEDGAALAIQNIYNAWKDNPK